MLLEQSHRNVYELLDLGFGALPHGVAPREGGDPIGAALRRLGRVRIATKYPRIAAAHFPATGRQAEIVEVKGSVELAPLTGLVDGIVDLTATGTTLAENGLRDDRGDRGLHRAPDRQPGGAQAEGGRDRRDRRAGAGAVRIGASGAELDAARAAAGASACARSCRRARRGDEAVLDYTERSTRPSSPRPAAGRRARARGALGVLEPGRAATACAAADRERRAPSREAQLRDPVAVELPRASRVEVVEVPGRRARASTCRAGAPPYPSTVVMCAVTARVAGVEQIAVCAPPAPGGRAHPVILAACVLCGVSEVYRMGGRAGDRRAGLRHRDRAPRVDVIVGPGQRVGHRGQAAGVRRRSASTAWPGRASCVVLAVERRRPELVALDLLAQAEHGEDSPVVG